MFYLNFEKAVNITLWLDKKVQYLKLKSIYIYICDFRILR